jgi:4-hydroxythreonine-4-phosphate dehydrogenase
VDTNPAHSRRIRIGISLGDPRGIGPEVTFKALAHPGIAEAAEFLLIGPASIVPDGLSWPLEVVGSGETRSELTSPATAGRVAGQAIERGVSLALAGKIDALVTAPIDKAAFHAGGWHFPGHTEMLQALTDAADVGMLMAAERTALGAPLRVLLATTHLALRDVPAAMTTELLVRQTTLLYRALQKWWAIDEPRIALCAFNPHASDNGLFGDEEARVMTPAVEALRSAGVPLVGPIPADTVFRRSISGEFHAVIAPYHDVGMAPFKTVAFGGGVNVTLGLPFPRTSPDHGTAIEIAGRGIADPASMVEAIQLAIRLTGRKDGVR